MGLRAILVFAAMSAALLGGCAFPTHDPSKLKAIRAEALALMAQAAASEPSLPESAWPPAIASLDPELVFVDPDEVDIVTKIWFEDHWGYVIPKEPRKAPERAFGVSNLGHGVYWYHAY